MVLRDQVWCDNMGAARTAPSVARSAEQLGLGPIDLVLVHWPGAFVRRAGASLEQLRANAALREETWRALEALQRAGRVKQVCLAGARLGAALLAVVSSVVILPSFFSSFFLSAGCSRRALLLAASRRIAPLVASRRTADRPAFSLGRIAPRAPLRLLRCCDAGPRPCGARSASRTSPSATSTSCSRTRTCGPRSTSLRSTSSTRAS